MNNDAPSPPTADLPVAALRHSRPGFTLMEVMIVVAIAGILGALVVPMFMYTSDAQLRAAAGELAADLDYARVESISQANAPRLLIITTNNTGYSIATAATPYTPITNPVTNQPYTVTFGVSQDTANSGVSIQSFSLGGTSQLQFGLYGQVTTNTSTSTITLAAGNKTVTVSVDPTSGQVTVGSVTP